MFKSRKAKGSLKKKREEDNDSAPEDERKPKEDGGIEAAFSKRTPKPVKKAKKKSGPSMSFLDDDPEEDFGGITTFKVKKSKLSKSIKRKMHQAPVLAEPEKAETNVSSSSSSNDYLSSLRAEQKFSAPHGLQEQQSGGGGLEG